VWFLEVQYSLCRVVKFFIFYGNWQLIIACSVILCMLTVCRSESDQICAILGYYAASSGSSLLTFRGKVSGLILILSVPSWSLKIETIDCPETSVRNYHHLLRNSLQERSSYLHKHLPLDLILIQSNPVHNNTTHPFLFHFNATLPSRSRFST